MKNIFKYIAITVISAGTLVSCSDSFLDGESSNVITPGEMEGSQDVAASSFLSGAYVQLFAPDAQASHDDFGYRAITLAGDMMTDDMAMPGRLTYGFGYDYQEENNALNYRRPNSTWAQMYAIIAAANSIIKDVYDGAKDESKLTDKDKAILGESYGLRGIAYFTLINRFQQPYFKNPEALGIPIYTEDIYEPGRNTVKDVYDVIISDLNRSYSFLEGKGFSSPGKLSEYVVKGFLARVYAFKTDEPNQWEKVAENAMFTAESRKLFNAEQLTSRATFSDLNAVPGGEVIWGSYINAETSTFYASFFSCIDPYSAGYGGAAWEAYVQIASKLYDEIPDTDARKEWWLSDTVKVPTADPNKPRKIPPLTQVKFVDKGAFTGNYVYMRTSEFYYLAAEAYYNLGKFAEAQKALQTVMETRNPDYNAYAYSGQDLFDQIVLQKRIELWGEGVRLDDMKRRNTALNRRGNTNNYPTVILELPANPIPWVYQIPSKELDNNDFITENNPV